MTKHCPICDKTKKLTDFPVSRRREKLVLKEGSTFKRSGNIPEIEYHTYCKKCIAIKAREFRKKYAEETGTKDYRGSGKITKYPLEDRPLMSAIRSRITSTKGNCKKTKVTFDITEEVLYKIFKEQEGKCALSGVKMQIDGNTNLRLSMDRINPTLGYIENNVQWTIFAANRAKGDMSSRDFIKLCGLIIERATTIESTPT